MPSYRAYGLRIDSYLALPELLCAQFPEIPADILIHPGTCGPSDADRAPAEICPWAGPDEICLHYQGIVKLLLRRGREVVVDAHPEADPRVLRLILLGPVLGLILHQRGFLVLHASAVQINKKTIAFIGDKGAGKSTAAAAFHARGYNLVADDIVAVSPESFLVHPGFPQLKVSPQAAAHLHGQTDDLPRLAADLDKLGLPARNTFRADPTPLHRVFALCDGDREAVESLGPQQAFMELVKNSYALTLLQCTHTEASHFHQAVALASKVPVRRLIRRRQLPALDDMIAAVVADVA